MPWRDTADPYRILVSEIMLQQTQVERVTDQISGIYLCISGLCFTWLRLLADVLHCLAGYGLQPEGDFFTEMCHAGYRPNIMVVFLRMSIVLVHISRYRTEQRLHQLRHLRSTYLSFLLRRISEGYLFIFSSPAQIPLAMQKFSHWSKRHCTMKIPASGIGH